MGLISGKQSNVLHMRMETKEEIVAHPIKQVPVSMTRRIKQVIIEREEEK
jgi:hypothetical protein